MKWVDRDGRLGRVLPRRLRVPGAHVERDHLDRVRAGFAELAKEPVRRLAVVALGPPHDLAADVVGHEREVVVLALPADLIDPDLKQVLETVRVQFIGADPADDPPNGVPVDSHQPGDRRLVNFGGQPGDERLEVAREPGAVPSERHALDPNPVLGALQSPQLRADLQAPDPEIEMPPDRLDLLTVVTMASRERAQRAVQPTASERHRDDHPIGEELHPPHPDPVQAQQARECRADAHRRPPCELTDLGKPPACLMRAAARHPDGRGTPGPFHAHSAGHPWPPGDPLTQAASVPQKQSTTPTAPAGPRTPRSNAETDAAPTYIDAGSPSFAVTADSIWVVNNLQEIQRFSIATGRPEPDVRTLPPLFPLGGFPVTGGRYVWVVGDWNNNGPNYAMAFLSRSGRQTGPAVKLPAFPNDAAAAGSQIWAVYGASTITEPNGNSVQPPTTISRVRTP